MVRKNHGPALFLSGLAVLVLFLTACSGSDSTGDADGDTDPDRPAGAVCSDDTDCPIGQFCDPTTGFCAGISPTDGDEDPDGDGGDVDTVEGKLIIVSPTTVDFGYVQYGQEEVKDINVRNDAEATEAAQITAIRFGQAGAIDFSFSVRFQEQEIFTSEDSSDDYDPVTLAPGQGLIIQVTYAPSDALLDTGYTIQIVTNDNRNPIIDVSLDPKYKGLPRLVVDPDPIEFAQDLLTGTTADIDVKLTNSPEDADSNQILRIANVTLNNGALVDDAFEIQLSDPIDPDHPKFLRPGDYVLAKVKFTPVTPGSYANTLKIQNNDPAVEGVSSVDITAGSGYGEEPYLEADPTVLDFDFIQIGQTVQRVVTITNRGAQALEMTSFEFSMVGTEGFEILDDPMLTQPLISGASIPLTVAYTADENAPAHVQQTLKIFSNASNAEPDGSISISITGETANPEFFCSISEWEFDGVMVGDRSPKQVMVKNTYNGSLTIYAVQVRAPGHPEFSVENLPTELANRQPIELSGNQSFTFDIVYEPYDTTDDTAIVEIIHNDFDLFEEGDSDRTEYMITVSSVNTATYETPEVVFKVHNDIAPVEYAFGSASPWQGAGFRAGTDYLLDISDSYDPDGGVITECELELVSGPGQSAWDLDDTHVCSATFEPDRAGQYSFRARVKDDESAEDQPQGNWSGWKTVAMTVMEPDSITILLGDMNVCIPGLYSYDLYLYAGATGTEDICAPTLCNWGPEHSGTCAISVGGQSGWTQINWDYDELYGDYSNLADTEYRISVYKSIPLFGEHVTLMLQRNGYTEPFWEAELDFSAFFSGTVEYTVQIKREKGMWREPYVWSPEEYFDCEASSYTFTGSEGACSSNGDCCSGVCGDPEGVSYCLAHCEYNNDCPSNCCHRLIPGQKTCVPTEYCEPAP